MCAGQGCEYDVLSWLHNKLSHLISDLGLLLSGDRQPQTNQPGNQTGGL